MSLDQSKRMQELFKENKELRKLLLQLVRKGNDGHWYTSQHGDTDVTYFVSDALTPPMRVEDSK